MIRIEPTIMRTSNINIPNFLISIPEYEYKELLKEAKLKEIGSIAEYLFACIEVGRDIDICSLCTSS